VHQKKEGSGSISLNPSFNIDGDTSTDGGQVLKVDLLTTFDGCYEQPGRIIIMTTNHKELIDDVLIRSGRVDYVIDALNWDDKLVKEMLYHSYCRSTNESTNDSTNESNAVLINEQIFEGEYIPSKVQEIVLSYDIEKAIELIHTIKITKQDDESNVLKKMLESTTS
jgi:ATP-dependent 26S proteasome regulatory subunit